MAAATQDNGYDGGQEEYLNNWESDLPQPTHDFPQFEFDTNVPTSYTPNLQAGQPNAPLLNSENAQTLDDFWHTRSDEQSQYPANPPTEDSNFPPRYLGSGVVRQTEQWDSNESMPSAGQDQNYRGEIEWEEWEALPDGSIQGDAPAAQKFAAAESLASLTSGQPSAWGDLGMPPTVQNTARSMPQDIAHNPHGRVANRSMQGQMGYNSAQSGSPFDTMSHANHAGTPSGMYPPSYIPSPRQRRSDRSLNSAYNDVNARNVYANVRRNTNTPIASLNVPRQFRPLSQPTFQQTSQDYQMPEIPHPMFGTDDSFVGDRYEAAHTDTSERKAGNLLGVPGVEEASGSSHAGPVARGYQSAHGNGQHSMPHMQNLHNTYGRVPNSAYRAHQTSSFPQTNPTPYQHPPRSNFGMPNMQNTNGINENGKRRLNQVGEEDQNSGTGLGLGINNHGGHGTKRARVGSDAANIPDPSANNYANPPNFVNRKPSTRQSIGTNNTTPSSHGSPANGTQSSAKKRNAVKRTPLTKNQKKDNHIASEKNRREKARVAYEELFLMVPDLHPSKPKVARALQVHAVAEYIETLQAGNRSFGTMFGIDIDTLPLVDPEDDDDDDGQNGDGVGGAATGGAADGSAANGGPAYGGDANGGAAYGGAANGGAPNPSPYT